MPISDAFVGDGIIDITNLSMHIVAWHQDVLKSLIRVLVVLRAPYLKLVSVFLPIDAVEIALRLVFERVDETLGFANGRCKIIKLFASAMVHWNELFIDFPVFEAI